MQEVNRLIGAEVRKKVRVQLEHMQSQGTLIDWVMRFYPRRVDRAPTVFGEALKEIRDDLLKKAGHTTCPTCGRQLGVKKSAEPEVGPEILGDTEAALEGRFE